MSVLPSLLSQHSIKQVNILDLADKLALPIIDCRPLQDFTQGHLIGSTWIDAQALFERMHELPQRHVKLTIYGDEKSLVSAIQFLTEKGYQIPKVALWNTSDSPLPVTYLETGDKSVQLWQPAKIIRQFIDSYLPRLNSTTQHKEVKKGLDIACGSGRDMISLAQHGLEITGVDYHSDALQRANRLAQLNQLNINTLQLDLESSDAPLTHFEPQSFHLICVLRYLHRPLLKQLDTLIAPGGFLVYQTFMQGCEKIGSPKNPRFLLKPNELTSVFLGYKVWLDEIETLADGRPVSAFIAQKPSECSNTA